MFTRLWSTDPNPMVWDRVGAPQHTLSSLGVRSGSNMALDNLGRTFRRTAQHNGSLPAKITSHSPSIPYAPTVQGRNKSKPHNSLSSDKPALHILCPVMVSPTPSVSYTSPDPERAGPKPTSHTKSGEPSTTHQTPPNIPPIQTGACPPFASSTTISSPFYSRLRVLFTFPSQYLFAIGLSLLFSLRCSLPPTLCCTPKQHDSLGATPNSHATQI